MVQKLELVKGGGGSIKVGATGTIGSLMTKELDSMKYTPPSPISTSRQKPSTNLISVSRGVVTSPKKLKPQRTLDNPSSSGSCGSSRSSSSNGNIYVRYPESSQNTRHNIRKKTHRVPMLGSDGAAVEITTPNREKTKKKGTNFVEVVDIKCGNPEKWSTPIANRFKRLSFSKLSEDIN